MGDKVHLQESKEFQLRIDVDRILGKSERVPGPSDEAIFAAVGAAIREAVASLGAKKTEVVIEDDLWWREGIRYDTEAGLFKANRLTLAIEATDKRTKLKCKQHDFVPELLFAKPGDSPAYPDIRASRGYKKHDTTFKREQDLHADNLKYCASGSLYVKGRQTEVRDTSFFSRYFPGLLEVAPEATPLRVLSHWNEAIFDAMTTRWGSIEIDSWMLVDRWQAGKDVLLESELSFKVARKMDEDWDYRTLREASRLYLALQDTGLFVALPPIFTYANPVSSITILRAPEEVAA